MPYNPSKRSRKNNPARIGKNRFAWVRVVFGELIVMKYDQPKEAQEDGAEPEEDWLKPESGPTIRIIIARNVGRPISLNLTALTLGELEYFRRIWNLAIDMAEPIVAMRDREAQEAYANGDDTYSRSYRPVPQFVIRQGEVGSHAEGLWDRSEDIPAGDRPARDTSEGVRVGGDELADGEPAQGGS